MGISIPTGTVTFLFTDIQGSTQLWQQYPTGMSSSLARHHAILNQAIENHHGYVFQIIGDAFCAAFQSTMDGLNACITAQRQLHDEPWNETGPIRVRMALHCEPAEVQAGEIVSGQYASGLTLSRTARLLSAGHGGQLLLSSASAEVVRDQLPIGVELFDLGSHRLRDLVQPEHIFQLVAAGLPHEFPAIKTLDARLHNLPAQLTSFVGRETEIQNLRAILDMTSPPTRLLTLSGPGGTGKTRLALQLAANLLGNHPDGVWFVDLSVLTEPDLVSKSVASVWGLREQPWRPLNDLLEEYLRTKRLLLVLDNCEHLVEACAHLAENLLKSCPDLKILATSRELLGVPGEVLYHVPTLSLPKTGAQPTPEAIERSEAVRLFIERIKNTRPDFALNQSNAPLVAHVCQRLDGIPLAIELAAARLRSFSLEQLAARLDDRFQVLSSGSRNSLPRQQTLRALIDWSDRLLSEAERALFHRLAIFQGGWYLDTAEVVCAGDGIESHDILDILARLVDRSLVEVERSENQPRYRMLETIRQFASQALEQSGQLIYWRQRHLEFYLKLALEAELKIRSEQDIVWLEHLERDHDNLRASFETAMQGKDTRSVFKLCRALHYFWTRRGHVQEGLNRTIRASNMENIEQHSLEYTELMQCLGLFYWLNGAYKLALDSLNQSIYLASTLGDTSRFAHALALYYRAITEMRLGDYVAANQSAENSLKIFRELEDNYGLAVTNYCLGRILIEQGQNTAALPLIELALKWSRVAGDRFVIALVLNSLVLLMVSKGESTAARELNRESLDLARQMNDAWMISAALREAGNLAQAQRDLSNAASLFYESGEISHQQGLMNDYARTRFNLGYVNSLQGKLSPADAYLQESWDLFSQLHNRRGQAECLDGFAALAVAHGKFELAARLLGTSDSVFHSMGSSRWPVDAIEYENLRLVLQNKLGIRRFDTYYAAVEELDPGQLLETAYESWKRVTKASPFVQKPINNE